MIRELKLSNFRLFDDEVTVRFRPITVLIGRNNAGKSSVINFLLMLQQSRNDSAAEFLNPEGERVKLGSFKSLKNSVSEKKFLSFELDIHTSKLPIDKLSKPIEATPERIEKRAHTDGAERGPKPDQRTEIRPEPQADFIVTASIPYNKVRVGNLRIEIKINGEFQDELKGKIRKISSSLISEITRIDKIDERLLSEKNPSKMISETLKIMDRHIYLSTLIEEIKNIKHISPTRVSFRRVVELATPPDDSVGQNGEYAIPHLHRLMEKPDRRSDILSMYLESLVDVESLEFKGQTLGALSHVTALATNSKTKARSYLSEFGFGVSQVIPVLVQGVLMEPYTQMMVEEPEAQLHPTSQLEMGSYFADLWKRRKVGSIIETHSGNILLRLRRLIAKGDLKPEDVSVAFFDNEEGKPIVKNLDIDSDGAMQEGLPMEFFGADIIEGLELGSRT